MRRVLALALVGMAAIVGCGEDESSAPAPDRPSSDDPLARAEAYAREQYPEATKTDDSLAAAVSGCYLGITGEYLGGPQGWSAEKVIRIEYPEPELQAVLGNAREDCR